ncbi:MAG: DUF6514 family protein [Clostridiales bacterium]|jgi:hypothetical protein|nr:DUF6514 family protein [Clostridiales bacterium]
MYYKRLLDKFPLKNEIENVENQTVLEYYLIKQDQNIDLNSFGICVSKKLNEVEQEEVCVENISSDRYFTEKIINLLMKNKVTPITTIDVLNDMGILH